MQFTDCYPLRGCLHTWREEESLQQEDPRRRNNFSLGLHEKLYENLVCVREGNKESGRQ